MIRQSTVADCLKNKKQEQFIRIVPAFLDSDMQLHCRDNKFTSSVFLMLRFGTRLSVGTIVQ